MARKIPGEAALSVINIVIGDSQELTQLGIKETDPTKISEVNRRLLIRSICTYLEMTAYVYKNLAIDSDDLAVENGGPRMTTVEERYFAEERRYKLDSDGTIGEDDYVQIDTPKNLRFAFALLARVLGNGYVLPVSENGWKCLRETIAVRNRLTHPRITTDLDVTDDEIRAAKVAYDWYHKQEFALIGKVSLKWLSDVAELHPESARSYEKANR